MVTKPVFSEDQKLILPEGAVLTGEVTFVKAARRFHRSGRLRFLFESVQAPERSPETLLASLRSVQAGQAERVVLDDEGGVSTTEPKARFIAPALASLALAGAMHQHLDYDTDRDAILAGEAYLTKSAARERKVLLVVSDGNDNASAASREEVREQARRSAIVLYAIGLLDAEHKDKAGSGREELDDLAAETGGISYFPGTLAEVQDVALRMAQQIRSQYTIAYSPTSQALDGSYRKIRAQARGSGHLFVRTRAGYRAVAGGIVRPATGTPGPQEQ